MSEIKIKIPEEVLQQVRRLENQKNDAELIAELVVEGLNSRRYSKTMDSLREGEISLARAAEEIGINPWEIFRKASKEDVLSNYGEDELKADTEKLGGTVIVDASVLIPLYDAGRIAEFSQGLARLGIGSPIIPYSVFTIVYNFAKSRNPSEDVSKPLKIYKVMEISKEEKEKAASFELKGLTSVDKEVIYIAKREKALLLTNDDAVVSGCKEAGIKALRFASALLKMIREKTLSLEDAAEIIYGVQWTGPRLREGVVSLLMQEIEKQ
jgi:rRNA-processing protein FCF1